MIVTSALKLIHPQNTKQETNKIACLPYAVHVTIEAWLCLQIASKLCCLYNHFQKFKHTKYYVPFVGKKNKRENGDWWNYMIWKSIHPYRKAFFFVSIISWMLAHPTPNYVYSLSMENIFFHMRTIVLHS